MRGAACSQSVYEIDMRQLIHIQFNLLRDGSIYVHIPVPVVTDGIHTCVPVVPLDTYVKL